MGRFVKGVQNFRRCAKGGGANLDFPKRGANILDFINFFSMFLKCSFFMFWGYFGNFSFLGPRGQNISNVSRRGGQNFLDASRELLLFPPPAAPPIT